MQPTKSEAPAVSPSANRSPSILSGAGVIGIALGGYCSKTVHRWWRDGVLEPFLYKGPRNSPLRIRRADLPKARERIAGVE
jgi:hypothetical protein